MSTDRINSIRIAKGRPALVLAPMEGVTDAPMRALLSEVGGYAFCVSEFFRISQDIPYPKAFTIHVPELKNGARTKAGLAVQVQLLGGNPEKLALSALRAIEAGATGIDLNFGCPAPTVNRNDGGATLLKCPERLEAIVRAVRDAVPAHLPVSAKLRLGWDDEKEIHINAQAAARGGAEWLTIHARTKTQGYRPPAHWSFIGEVRRALDIPVVANGDIWTVDDFKKCREQTECEHFMLGRSALADPHLALRLGKELGLVSHDVSDVIPWADLIERFVSHALPYANSPSYALCRIKQWLRMAGPQRIARLEYIKSCTTIAQAIEAVRCAEPKAH